jgi:hypothetical protein
VTPSGAVAEFNAGLNTGAQPNSITAGPDGQLWFTDTSGAPNAIGRISTSGAITEFSGGLSQTTNLVGGIAAGADGSLWATEATFSTATGAIARVGSSAPAASVRAPSVTGSGQQGTQQVCQGDQWSPWADQLPLDNQFGFDGFQWLRDGAPLAGQTRQSYTPSVADVGHILTCTVTVSYQLLGVTASATSAGVTVIPLASGPAGAPGQDGQAGAEGRTGPAGAAGKVQLVTCQTVTKTVTRKHNKVHVKQLKCTTKLVTGPVKFTTTSAPDRAALSRGEVTYATGYARVTNAGLQTHLLAPRTLARGLYTLTFSGRGITRRMRVAIG